MIPHPGQIMSKETWAIAIPPLVLAGVLLTLRSAGGPFWMEYSLDPDYFYLIDALYVARLEPPGTIYHPGFTLHVVGGIVLRLRHPLLGAEDLTAAVLADPEAHLRLLSSVVIAALALATLVVGIVARWATGSVLQAMVAEIGPFLSSLTLKNEFHFKPEAFLVLAILGSTALALATLRPGALDAHRFRFAVAFGVVAGLGVATKITAAPVFILMPVFLLGTARAFAVAALAAALAFLLFAIPAGTNLTIFIDWIGRVIVAAGPHGQGLPTVVDIGAYPRDVLRMLNRAPLNVVFVLSLFALGLAAWRARRGTPLPSTDTRILAGIVLAEVAQAVLVGKQPWGQYMIPSYVLSALALVVLLRLARVALKGWVEDKIVVRVAGAVFALLALGQAAVAHKVGRELAEWRRAGLALDDGQFGHCARIYFYAASSPAFALYLADHVTAVAFDGRRIRAGLGAYLRPPAGGDVYWLDDWYTPGKYQLRDWSGVRDMSVLARDAACIVLRGGYGRAPTVETYLSATLPARRFTRACGSAREPMYMSGVACDGTRQ